MKNKLLSGMGIIVLTLLAYMSFILYIALIRPNVASELVSERYYEEEIKHQEVIDEKKNANALIEKVKIQVVSEGIRVSFPCPFNAQNITGECFLLRPSDKRWDIRKPLVLDGRAGLLIPASVLTQGAYEIRLRWCHDGKKYLVQQALVWTP